MDIYPISPMWENEVAVCIGGGASLTKDQVNACEGLRAIAVNDAYKLAPWADILYACDYKWWNLHKGVAGFKGLRLQHYYKDRLEGQSLAKAYPGIACVLSDGTEGFSESCIRHGGNSGYQALHLALRFGVRKIILLGYDMHIRTGKSHWFGEHPFGCGQDPNKYVTWSKRFSALREAADRRGQMVINCSPGSALECFEKMELHDALNV